MAFKERRVDGVPHLRAKFLSGAPRAEIERHVVKPNVPVTLAPGSADAHALPGVPMIGLGLPGGAIPGTQPEAAVIAAERRRREAGP